jgi:hypothetical protein
MSWSSIWVCAAMLPRSTLIWASAALDVRRREEGQVAELDGFHVRPIDHRTQGLGDGYAPLNDVVYRLTLRRGQEQHHCTLRDQQQHHGEERNGKPGGDFKRFISRGNWQWRAGC